MAPSNGNNNTNNAPARKVLTADKKGWPEDAKTTLLQLTAAINRDVKYYKQFFILTGNEIPKMYFIWFRE